MWAYTSTYNSFISLPNILGVRPDALPVKWRSLLMNDTALSTFCVSKCISFRCKSLINRLHA